MFGLSYGGFLTLQAMTVDPTLWRAGIDVAGVVDWATYGAGYTTPRLGTPVQNPDIYNISAPIQHMDKLARPLLVLHGTNDRNVSFADSLRLFDVLIKLGKQLRVADLSWRNSFLPPGHRAARCLETRRGILRPHREERTGPHGTAVKGHVSEPSVIT